MLKLGVHECRLFAGWPAPAHHHVQLQPVAPDTANSTVHIANISTPLLFCPAVGLQLSRALRDHARSIPGKAQLFINAYAKALEAIPRQLCDNAGFDATDVLNKLRQKHALADGSGKVRECECSSLRHDGVVGAFRVRMLKHLLCSMLTR
jgi:hypothetical protein